MAFAAVGMTTASAQPASITGLQNSTYAETYIRWTWTDPLDTDFLKVMVYIDGDFETNVSKDDQYYNATSLDPNTEHEIGTHTVDINGSINTAWENHTARTKPSSDTTPPASITDLQNSTYAETYIRWTWTDPLDTDFLKVMVYIDGMFKKNVSKHDKYYNATSLDPNTEHEIGTHTVDTNGNANTAWENHTARTKPSSDTTPPASITNLQNTTGETNIKWTWTDPGDATFVVMVYIDGVFKKNVSKETESYDATGFTAGTSHTIGTRTANGSSINTAWVNDTAKTKSAGHSTGFRIWDADRDPLMDLNYTWDARSYTGFYYDIDDDISTETLTVELDDYDERNIEEGNLKYITEAADIDFEYNDWGSYKVIGFMAEKYFAGYDGDNTSITNDDIRLLSKDMLSKVLIDEDEKHMISTGASLELKEGYELKIIQLDIDGGQAQIELLKDGKSVDNDIVTSPDDYVYTEDLGKLDDVPLVVVHINSVFAGTESDMLVINGIFQISDDLIPVDDGEDYGEMEIQSATGYTIKMENSDDIDLEEDEIVDIMGNLKFLVADNSTLRFALYEEITEPGTHDIRGTVHDTNGKAKWDHMNFEGFYYNIDDDLGTEELQVEYISGTTIDEGDLVYTTKPQLVSFDYSKWDAYEVIGFMAEPYPQAHRSS
jgi:S-layer protein (TIGR01567 family)